MQLHEDAVKRVELIEAIIRLDASTLNRLDSQLHLSPRVPRPAFDGVADLLSLDQVGTAP